MLHAFDNYHCNNYLYVNNLVGYATFNLRQRKSWEADHPPRYHFFITAAAGLLWGVK
jgi:hypothetical protein